jgi:fatty acid CoA ligase FadD36
VLLPSLNPNVAARGVDIPDAVTIEGVSLSRSDVVGGATAVAERIHGLHRVAVLAEPTVSTVLAMLGGLVAGVSIVPVPPDSGPIERGHLLTDSGAEAWLGATPGESDPSLPVVPVRVHARSWHSFVEPEPDHTAFILYTSGTTGLPKGALISRRAVAAGLDAVAPAWEWSADDILVHGLPLFHLHGLILGLLGPLRVGSRLIHTGRPTPQAYAAASGSLYFGVPTVWSRLAEHPSCARRLASARLLVSGSAPLPVPVSDRIAELTGRPPIERYGMTETGITLSARAQGPRRAGWVGRPLAGVHTRLCGEAGEHVAHDGMSIGGLQVRAPMMFDGYLGRPDATAAAWTDDGWFLTGDVALVDADGCHRIVGRAATDLIKTGGYRVGAGEVEAALLGHRCVAEAAVIGAPDEDLGQRIVAYVVLREHVDGQQLIDHVATTLSAHKRPREVRVVDALPRNAMGKLQKNLLG